MSIPSRAVFNTLVQMVEDEASTPRLIVTYPGPRSLITLATRWITKIRSLNITAAPIELKQHMEPLCRDGLVRRYARALSALDVSRLATTGSGGLLPLPPGPEGVAVLKNTLRLLQLLPAVCLPELTVFDEDPTALLMAYEFCIGGGLQYLWRCVQLLLDLLRTTMSPPRLDSHNSIVKQLRKHFMACMSRALDRVHFYVLTAQPPPSAETVRNLLASSLAPDEGQKLVLVCTLANLAQDYEASGVDTLSICQHFAWAAHRPTSAAFSAPGQLHDDIAQAFGHAEVQHFLIEWCCKAGKLLEQWPRDASDPDSALDDLRRIATGVLMVDKCCMIPNARTQVLAGKCLRALMKIAVWADKSKMGQLQHEAMNGNPSAAALKLLYRPLYKPIDSTTYHPDLVKAITQVPIAPRRDLAELLLGLPVQLVPDLQTEAAQSARIVTGVAPDKVTVATSVQLDMVVFWTELVVSILNMDVRDVCNAVPVWASYVPEGAWEGCLRILRDEPTPDIPNCRALVAKALLVPPLFNVELMDRLLAAGLVPALEALLRLLPSLPHGDYWIVGRAALQACVVISPYASARFCNSAIASLLISLRKLCVRLATDPSLVPLQPTLRTLCPDLLPANIIRHVARMCEILGSRQLWTDELVPDDTLVMKVAVQDCLEVLVGVCQDDSIAMDTAERAECVRVLTTTAATIREAYPGVDWGGLGHLDGARPGCYFSGCTNLSGPSEAALKTCKCSGCRIACYCCAACQAAAWKGHKVACRARPSRSK